MSIYMWVDNMEDTYLCSVDEIIADATERAPDQYNERKYPDIIEIDKEL